MAAPEYPATADGLFAVLKRLRAPGGCPWDRKQTRASLKRHLAGEVAELLDAIDREVPSEIAEELGDVLMNLFFQVIVAEEKGEFTLTDVWRGIVEKMIRRHEHVFGTASAATADEVVGLWQRVKARERGLENAPAPESQLDGVQRFLSALDRATALQRAAAKVGFDWPDESGVMTKVAEEAAELSEAACSGSAAAVEEELGDLMFSAVNLARFRGGADAEELLRRANRKFERRFRRMEELIKADGGDVASAGAVKMDDFWRRAKAEESAAPSV